MPDEMPVLRRAVRCAQRSAGRGCAGAAVGSAIGWIQYCIDVGGMRAAAASPGLAGIGVGFSWSVAFVVVSVLLALLGCRVLRLVGVIRAAAVLLIGEAFVGLLLWDHASAVGLHGDRRAVLIPIITTAEYVLVALRWRRRGFGRVTVRSSCD